MSYLYALEMRIPDYPFAPIKLGFSREPQRRVKAVCNGPFPTVWLGQWGAPNGYADERALHARFQEFRLFGEWFYPCPELLAYLKATLGTGAPKRKTAKKVLSFETRYRNLFAETDQPAPALLPDPFDMPPTFKFCFNKDVDEYMAKLTDRWPVRGDWAPERQLLRSEDLAPLLGLSVSEVTKLVPALNLNGRSRRYRLLEVRAFLEHNDWFLERVNRAA